MTRKNACPQFSQDRNDVHLDLIDQTEQGACCLTVAPCGPAILPLAAALAARLRRPHRR